MPELPYELRIKSEGDGEVEAISTRPEITLHVSTTLNCVARQSQPGFPDPGAQHEDGAIESDAGR